MNKHSQNNVLRLILVVFIGLMLGFASSVFMPISKVMASSGNVSYPDGATPLTYPSNKVKCTVYQNLLETGDRLFLIYADIPYTVLPTPNFTDLYTWTLYSGNDTVLGYTNGTNFNDNGYGWNVFAMYFPASAELLWVPTSPYYVKLTGDPLQSWTYDNHGTITSTDTPAWRFNLDSSCYNSLTDVTAVRGALADKILSIADDLDKKWSLAVSTYLIYQETNTTVLSMYGEGFFNQAIPYLQYIAPTLYEQQEQTVDYSRRTWGSNYTVGLGVDQWTGTWIETAREGNAALFGGSYDLTSIIILFFVCIAVVFANISVNPGEYWAAFIDVAFLLVVTARLGVYGLGFLALLDALCIIYIGIKIWGITGNG